MHMQFHVLLIANDRIHHLHNIIFISSFPGTQI